MAADQLKIEVGGFPTAIRPMQADSAEDPFRSEDYAFEVKWEGIRCVMFVEPNGHVRLQDRGLNDISADFPELLAADIQVPTGSVLDGELVTTDEEGRPDRGRLRERLEAGGKLDRDIPAAFLAFDALYIDSQPLLRQPLERRRARLKRAVTTGGCIFVPDHIVGGGPELYEACLERGLAGIVAKHLKSPYVPGQRSPFWLRIMAAKSDDFVVTGWTPGDPFGALLIAYYEQGRLLPCGAVTGGFDEATAGLVARRLAELETGDSPLDPPPVMTAPLRWCRPELVVNVRYSEWAPDGTLRFPIFNGLRPEVHPAECVRHLPRMVIGGRIKPDSPAYSLTRFPF